MENTHENAIIEKLKKISKPNTFKLAPSCSYGKNNIFAFYKPLMLPILKGNRKVQNECFMSKK